ncbi:zinc-dependent alcohol dehydrogenase family protein [Streptomyces sp. NPDC086777]|uniref:zinc-dependent alcohol dehydrogenase family protein n=1 Tax=Streptomyces sp. NPDC086777 TaxID=3154866 RepID=UPI003450FBDD
MRAVVLEEFGAPMVLKEIAKPVAGPGQVLVRIEASGVNPLDIKIAAGQAAHAKRTPPAVLGLDMAGVVEQVGPGVSGFAPGDEVYGMTGGVGDLQGSLAQYAAVDARLLAHKPKSLDMRQAAALPLVTITAWEGLIDRAQVGVGRKVLIHGGAGGVGHVGIQIARARGAEVFGTDAPHRLKAVEALGATAIDYTAETPDQYVARLTDGEGFDIVYDTVGGPVLDASFAIVRTYTGHVLSSLGWGTHSIAPLSFRGATYSGVFTLAPMLTGRARDHHGEILREITGLVDAGKLTPTLDPRHFSLADTTDAHTAVADGSATGKIVVSIGH